ncbi:two component transcriptional regulator AraC family [Firmicutes bacterium CAG:449]|nr:two component transcriptional regulator AraC family [Firmicutes bacterium CAG:449]
MLTVYFVDDDILIINELKNIINWNEYYFEIVGYNVDPLLAKEEILQKKPTLVICDVQMDGLNGFKLAESIKQLNSHINFVYLSAYDKFDYAVEAIRLGAIRYIKKPLKKEQLINLLLEINTKNQTDFNEQIYNNLVNHAESIKDLFENNALLPKNESFNIITLNGKNHQKVIEDIQDISSMTYCIYSDENFTSVIVFNLNNFTSFIQNYPKISSGISPILTNYEHIDKYLRLTRIASKQKFLTGKNEHIIIEENNNYLKICNQFKECEKIFELQQLIKNLKENLIKNNIIVYSLQSIYKSIVYALIRFNLVDKDIFDISVLDEYDNIDDLINDLLNYFNKNDNNDFSELIINEVKNELINNIDKKIPLSYFAKKYGYNISYFSQLFKKIVGTSFAEYFILLKMDKAKLLITNSSTPLQNIASSVGYDDYYHFSKMFKKYTQYSPTEFRNIYIKK